MYQPAEEPPQVTVDIDYSPVEANFSEHPGPSQGTIENLGGSALNGSRPVDLLLVEGDGESPLVTDSLQESLEEVVIDRQPSENRDIEEAETSSGSREMVPIRVRYLSFFAKHIDNPTTYEEVARSVYVDSDEDINVLIQRVRVFLTPSDGQPYLERHWIRVDRRKVSRQTEEGEKKQYVELTARRLENLELIPEQALKLDRAILGTEEYWLTEIYSLAMHNQDLLRHCAALEAHLNGDLSVPIPRKGAFHHPEVIIDNAETVLNTSWDLHSDNGQTGSPAFRTLGLYNLQLLKHIQEMEQKMGANTSFDRRNRRRNWSPEEDEKVLKAIKKEEIERLAADLGIDPMKVITRRTRLRKT